MSRIIAILIVFSLTLSYQSPAEIIDFRTAQTKTSGCQKALNRPQNSEVLEFSHSSGLSSLRSQFPNLPKAFHDYLIREGNRPGTQMNLLVGPYKGKTVRLLLHSKKEKEHPLFSSTMETVFEKIEYRDRRTAIYKGPLHEKSMLLAKLYRIDDEIHSNTFKDNNSDFRNLSLRISMENEEQDILEAISKITEYAKSRGFQQKLHFIDTNKPSDQFVLSLVNLISAFGHTRQEEKSIAFQVEAMTAIKELYQANPEQMDEAFNAERGLIEKHFIRHIRAYKKGTLAMFGAVVLLANALPSLPPDLVTPAVTGAFLGLGSIFLPTIYGHKLFIRALVENEERFSNMPTPDIYEGYAGYLLEAAFNNLDRDEVVPPIAVLDDFTNSQIQSVLEQNGFQTTWSHRRD